MRRKFSIFFISIFILLNGEKINSSTPNTATEGTSVVKKDSVKGIYYSLHLIWEGMDIIDYHIQKLIEFRERFPDLPIIHHVSPRYSTTTVSKFKLKKALEKVYKEGDQIGIYISGWKTVIKAANVKFRTKESFWGNTLTEDCYYCGSEIPISSYNKRELEEIISWTIEEIDDLGFGTPKSSFIAGWQGTKEVLEVLSKHGILVDYSMIAPYRISDNLQFQNIYKYLLDYWGYRSESLTPLAKKIKNDKIFQIPNNFAHPGVIPLTTALELLAQIFQAIDRSTYNGSTISLMVSQNRLYNDISHIEKFTQELFKMTSEMKIDFNMLISSPLYYDPDSIKMSKAGTWNWPNHNVMKFGKQF